MNNNLNVTQWLCALLVSCVVAAPVMAAPAYPLKKSANGRYLVDQNNTPFLIAGDSPQALVVDLSDTDQQMFLTDRATNGFNTVWINVLCNAYAGGRADGSTFDGVLPFTSTIPSTSSYDLTTPNEAYFTRVDRALTLAAQQGLLVINSTKDGVRFVRKPLDQLPGKRFKGGPIWEQFVEFIAGYHSEMRLLTGRHFSSAFLLPQQHHTFDQQATQGDEATVVLTGVILSAREATRNPSFPGWCNHLFRPPPSKVKYQFGRSFRSLPSKATNQLWRLPS